MIQAKDNLQEIGAAIVRFAGDSGDGMQTVGEQFTDSSAFAGNDTSTLPDFPAEIRAPAGSLGGVSGFQLKFGSRKIHTPGDRPDALVAMNPAALKVNLGDLVEGGMLVVNVDTFNKGNLAKAGYDSNPLEDKELREGYNLIEINLTDLTKEALSDSPLKSAEKLRCKNFLALGFMFYVYDRPLEPTIRFLKKKWGKR
ncbi:MAG: 2-oxoglutarate ferredoxin oxidoreductase subunit alpha, partial [Opitutales bacterium]|nr:2-oxoglutarate ferredoxin oxidoreductase subunit alpha [Opitutales bacterium]